MNGTVPWHPDPLRVGERVRARLIAECSRLKASPWWGMEMPPERPFDLPMIYHSPGWWHLAREADGLEGEVFKLEEGDHPYIVHHRWQHVPGNTTNFVAWYSRAELERLF